MDQRAAPDLAGPTIVYDGECPFCSNYVQMLRLRETLGNVTLLDARDGGPVVDALWRAGYDLDQGMAVMVDGQIYHGGDAMNRIALLSSSNRIFNRFNRAVFRNPAVSRALYPALRGGRNMTLRLLGRRKLRDGDGSPAT